MFDLLIGLILTALLLRAAARLPEPARAIQPATGRKAS